MESSSKPVPNSYSKPRTWRKNVIKRKSKKIDNRCESRLANLGSMRCVKEKGHTLDHMIIKRVADTSELWLWTKEDGSDRSCEMRATQERLL